MEGHYRLIPMQIEAVIIPENDRTTYANINPNFNSLKIVPSGEAIEASPFTINDTPEEAGIHIHWILPEEVTHGRHEENEIVYPPMPNRYLVTRLSVSSGKDGTQTARKTWIVESDSLTVKRGEQNKNSDMILSPENDRQPYRYLGECREFLGEVTSSTKHLSDFHACINGIPYYAAYYPMCRNVLGFHDGMEDVEQVVEAKGSVRVSYVVTGWYCDPIEGAFPNHVYHGLLYGLEWKGRRFPYPSGVPQLDNIVKVSVGTSNEQAMAALVAFHKNNSLAGHIAESLMEESLQEWSRLDGVLEAEYKMHKNGFGAVESGWMAEIYREESRKEENGDVKQDKEDEVRLNSLLASVRSWQNIENELVLEKQMIQQELTDIWRCYAEDGSDIVLERARTEILGRIRQLSRVVQCYKDIHQHIEHQKAKLEAGLKECEELRSCAGQRFYLCNNLVVMLEGAGKNTMLDNRAQREQVETDYRCETDILKEKVGKKADEMLALLFPQKLSDLSAESDERTREILDVAQALVGEALIDENIFYSRRYEEGWNPLVLEWELEFYPDKELLKDEYTLKNWRLEGLDFIYTESFPDLNCKEVYRGRTILTDYASQMMKKASENFIKTRDGSYVIPEMPYQVLSQALTGFREGLLMRRQNIQYPIKARSGLNAELAELAGPWTQGVESLSASYDNRGFYPVLAGYLRFTTFHVIDNFGRVQLFKPASVIVPDRYQTLKEKMSIYMVMPPRLLQPARIQFQWRNLKDDLPCADIETTSPICGWIWPNFAESSLLVYAPEGDMLGSIQTVYDVDSGYPETIWRNAPGENYLKKEYPLEMPPEMRKLLEGICDCAKKEGDLMVQLLRLLDESFWNMQSPGRQEADVACAVLGHPIAVAKASIALEMQGRLAKPPMSLSQDKVSYAKLDETLFPVRFGNPRQKGDGVVGFYDLDSEEPYSHLHVCGVEHKNGEEGCGYLCECAEVSVKISTKRENRKLLFLLSPYGKLHIFSGILPVKAVSLPRRLVSRAMEKLFYTLYCAPVLSPSNVFSIPFPHSEGRTWSYLKGKEDGVWEKIEEIKLVEETAFLYPPPYELAEGWLKQTKEPET